MKDWRTLLIQNLLQQNLSVTEEDKVATGISECKQLCSNSLLTDLAVMMRIDPLALVFGLREFVTVVSGPVMSHAFPDVQVEAYRNSVLYVNLVPVVDCSVLNWVEQKELRGLASDDSLFGRTAEPGWMLMDFNNNFKFRMGGEDITHVQFNSKLWNVRPVVKGSGEEMRVPAWLEAYAHVKENHHGPQRRMLLGVTSPTIAPRIANEVEGWSWKVAAVRIFDFTFPDAWNPKKIKAPPSREPGVSADVWNNVYTRADDLSRLKWPGEVKVKLLEVTRECRGGIYMRVDDLAPHGYESVEFLVRDELFYHAGDLTVPPRPDSRMDMRQGPSVPGPKPDAKDNDVTDQDEDPMEVKEDKTVGLDLDALERDLLEYQFGEDDDDDGDVDEPLLLIMPSSFMSPTKEAPAACQQQTQ